MMFIAKHHLHCIESKKGKEEGGSEMALSCFWWVTKQPL